MDHVFQLALYAFVANFPQTSVQNMFVSEKCAHVCGHCVCLMHEHMLVDILTGEGSVEPTPVYGTIRITNLGPEATVEKLEELFGSLGKIKVLPFCVYCKAVATNASFFLD